MMLVIGLSLLAVSILFFAFLVPLFVLVGCLISVAALAAVYQERKIWLDPRVPSISSFGMIKLFVLNYFWMSTCLAGSILTAVEAVVTKNGLDLKYTREFAHKSVERRVGILMTWIFAGPVIVKGTENLPPDEPGSPAPIFIANHACQADTAVVYHLERHWRWIMKSSIMFLPGVGQITYLGDHIWIDRSKRKNSSKDSITGARNLYVKSDASIQEGVPIFIFPQGTRRMAERLPFKDGAFKVAKSNDSALVPISIDVPLMIWNSSYPFGKADPIVLTVHKPIESKGKDIETLKKETSEIIYSVLPDHSKQD
jgi:1-acyl-sn-glycerol-3-phosphate acyltransferase